MEVLLADIDKLKELASFINDLTDIVAQLMKDDKVNIKDLLNKDLYAETLDLLKWKGFFEENFDEMVEEAKDLDAMETIELYTALVEAIQGLYQELKH